MLEARVNILEKLLMLSTTDTSGNDSHVDRATTPTTQSGTQWGTQETTQSVTQSVTQSGTQSATQSARDPASTNNVFKRILKWLISDKHFYESGHPGFIPLDISGECFVYFHTDILVFIISMFFPDHFTGTDHMEQTIETVLRPRDDSVRCDVFTHVARVFMPIINKGESSKLYGIPLVHLRDLTRLSVPMYPASLRCIDILADSALNNSLRPACNVKFSNAPAGLIKWLCNMKNLVQKMEYTMQQSSADDALVRIVSFYRATFLTGFRRVFKTSLAKEDPDIRMLRASVFETYETIWAERGEKAIRKRVLDDGEPDSNCSKVVRIV